MRKATSRNQNEQFVRNWYRVIGEWQATLQRKDAA